MLLASLGNPSEDNNRNFVRVSLTDIFLIGVFSQLKWANKILLGITPRSFFLIWVTPELDSAKNMQQKI